MLANYKVVKSKPGLKWVSWVYRDAIRYGFENDDGEMLEVFQPTAKLRGNGLRAHVAKIFAWKEAYMYLGRWPSVAMDVNEVMPGHYLVYQAGPGQVVFAKVTHVDRSLIWGTTLEGDDSVWLAEKLDMALQTREVQCIAAESVPSQLLQAPSRV